MVLRDKDIEHCISTDGLIENADIENNLRNCAYLLRVGEIIDPETGEFSMTLENNIGVDSTKVYVIKPNEVVIAMTLEMVKMPPWLSATYSPLDRLAKKGVMLLNPSVVEPGYRGPLSCVMLNFSSVNVTLNQGDPLVKISFQKLTAAPDSLRPLDFSRDEYRCLLSKQATSYKRTFLDVENIKKATIHDLQQQAKRYVITGGILVLIIVIWSTIEPFVQKRLYRSIGVIEKNQRLEETTMLKNMEQRLQKACSDFELRFKEIENRQTSADVAELKNRIQKLEVSLVSTRRQTP